MITNVIYLVAIIVAGGLTTAMAIHLWINRKILEQDFSIYLVIFLWVWITAQIGECAVGPLGLKVVFYKIKFISISMVSVYLLGFALHHFFGPSRRLRVVLAAVAAPIVLCQIFTLFPYFERLAWTRFYVTPNNLVIDIDPGLGYVVYNVYNVFFLLLAYAFLLAGALSPRTSRRLQLLPFLAAGLLASGAALADFLLKSEIFYYRTMPIALSISSLSVVYYIRLRYFRTIPLAQHAVSQSLADGLVILNPHDEIMYVNPAAYGLFHLPSTAIIGRPLSSFAPRLAQFAAGAGEDGARNRTAEFEGKFFDVSLSTVKGRRGRAVSKIIVLRDVTHLVKVEESLRELTNELERKVAERTKQLEDSNRALQAEVDERRKAEERIKASLEEKSVLLGELHHRVKNNLQVVSSLLKLQSHYISDPAAQELFAVSVSRIRSMAMVHEKLYKSEDLAHTQFGQYLHELVHSVIFSHSKTSEQFRVALAIEPINLDIDKSILTGLIVNELVMNSLKHAFPAGGRRDEPGGNKISVGFRLEEGDYVLEYGDNGQGLPPGFDIEKSDSLGMKIVFTLVKQLKGTIDLIPDRGMKALIRFPVRKD
jgi:two-component sensor histidine kinase/PAS domain-containing protein